MFDRLITKVPMYDPVAVQPMRDELTWVGFEETRTEAEVERFMRQETGTSFVFINSICGCAAGSARPAAAQALQHTVIPDRLATVFAGMDRDAVDYFRSKYLPEFPPSSPAMFLFKDGNVVLALHRHDIEDRTPEDIASELIEAFDRHCDRTGPSIPPERYEKLVHAKTCGSSIPRYEK